MIACDGGSSPEARTAGTIDTIIPAGPLGESIRHGRDLVRNTGELLPDNTGNALRCVSCHLDDGRRATGSWVGVYGRYPQYRSRSASVVTIEDRVNGCFRRSMNGRPLPVDGGAMRDIVAYLWWLSNGTTIGPPASRQDRAARFGALRADTAAGATLFATHCARCHGVEGEGMAIYPPLWGPRSFNIGAGMARRYTAATFIAANMPFDQPGTLTDQQALDIAAYVTSKPRPDFPGKENDWPAGGAPSDAAYPVNSTHGGRNP